mmetsp:Transcript_1350/g.3345  ORF Transcript_1350/g.3345 Transcript_1350/m.3345 type:complete len:212 (-) Transcript_1350:850-1485(-)
MAAFSTSTNRFPSSFPKARVSISVRIACRRTDSCSWYMSDGRWMPSVCRLTMIFPGFRTMEIITVRSPKIMYNVFSLFWLAVHEFRDGVFCLPTRNTPRARRNAPTRIEPTGISKRSVRCGSSSSSVVPSAVRPYSGTVSAGSSEATYHIARANRRDGRPRSSSSSPSSLFSRTGRAPCRFSIPLVKTDMRPSLGGTTVSGVPSGEDRSAQ